MSEKPPKIADEYSEKVVNRELQRRNKTNDAFSKEARLSGDKNKETLANCLKAKTWMYGQWGVDNLSTIESVRLRKIVEEVFKESEQTDTKREADASASTMFDIDDPVMESAARWLWELYGIPAHEIPCVYTIKDQKTGQKFVYESGEKDSYDQKWSELAERDHEIPDFSYRIPNDFKDYLRDLREKAHMP